MRCLGLLSRFACLIFVCGTPSVAAADAAIALSGDSAPGSGGGTFSSFFDPDISDAGRIVFRANITGGTAFQGVYVDTGSALLAIAVSGDVAPDASGATFNTFGEPVINDANVVAFSASLQGGTGGTTWGLYTWSGGAIQTVVNNQSTAPGTAGGNYVAFGPKIAINAGGEIAFVANVGSGSTTEGLFVEGGGSSRAVFLIGDPAPTGVSGTYNDFSPPAIDDAGNVATIAFFFIPPFDFTTAVVVDESGGPRAAARVGDSAPGTGAGTYQSFSGFGAPAIDATGAVYFKATVTGGTAADGVFVDDAGTDSAVALQGDAAPNTGGGSYGQFAQTGLRGNEAGDLGFSATLIGATSAQGLFNSLAAGADVDVALVGGAVPDVPGGTFSTLGDPPALNSFDLGTHRASFLDGGMGRTGVFFVPEPSGVVPLAIGLAGVVGLARTRRS